MSNEIAVNMIELVKKQEKRFLELDAANGNLVDFTKECLFARQQLLKNDYTLKVASENPNSLQGAVLNVAAIGISLNPASQHAFLVPRKGSICLDISYRGLVKLATDCGAIKWAKAELVYDNDFFEWNGPAEKPTHKADPFSERGEMKGGYVLAMLPDGTVMVEVMPVAEIYKIRDTSEAYKKNYGPWVDWPEEMAKKTIVKRAYKSWPQSTNRERLDKAIEVLNQHEGMAYTIDQHREFMRLFEAKNATGLYLFSLKVGRETWIALFNSFPKGEKTKNKNEIRELERQGVETLQDYIREIDSKAESGDDAGVHELVSELEPLELEYIKYNASEAALAMIEELKQAA